MLIIEFEFNVVVNVVVGLVEFLGFGRLKTGLKVFVIPKNLGNNYFTTADSAKTGGAMAALEALGETGTETSGTGDHAGLAAPGHPGGDQQGRERAHRLGHRPDGPVLHAQRRDEARDHGRHL